MCHACVPFHVLPCTTTSMASQSGSESSCVWPPRSSCVSYDLRWLMLTNTHDVLCPFVCTAETEQQGTDHLDLAGLPQRSTNSGSTHTLSTTPESKKKSKGIKKLFGKWVKMTQGLLNLTREFERLLKSEECFHATLNESTSWCFYLTDITFCSGLKEVSLPHLTWTTTSQRGISRGVECEPQRDPDWVGLGISSEAISKSANLDNQTQNVFVLLWICCLVKFRDLMIKSFFVH